MWFSGINCLEYNFIVSIHFFSHLLSGLIAKPDTSFLEYCAIKVYCIMIWCTKSPVGLVSQKFLPVISVYILFVECYFCCVQNCLFRTFIFHFSNYSQDHFELNKKYPHYWICTMSLIKNKPKAFLYLICYGLPFHKTGNQMIGRKMKGQESWTLSEDLEFILFIYLQAVK